MTIEFNVRGRPVSAQSSNIPSLRQWQLEVSRAATSALALPPFSRLFPLMPLNEAVHIEAIYFYPGQRAMIDVDNMLKPMLDALKRLVFTDDRHVIDAEVRLVSRYAASPRVRIRRTTDHGCRFPALGTLCLRKRRCPVWSHPVKETNAFEEVVQEYQALGYRVQRGPIESLDAPVAIDLIAFGPDETVVVEIKRWSEVEASDHLRRLAEWVVSRPGWRLELIVTGAKSARVPPELTLSQAKHRIELADRLKVTKDVDAATLLLWSAAEAIARHFAGSRHIEIDLASPDDVLNLLISEGLVDKTAEESVQLVAYAATFGAHGYGLPLPERAFVVARRAIGILLDRTQHGSPPESQ